MRKILIIDDDERFLGALCEMLSDAGYDVRSATDGEEGVKLLGDNPVDLVITDIIMPGQEGIETVYEIRHAYPELPIVAMSGGGPDGSYLPTALALGADKSLEKPFPRQLLLETVDQLLAA